MTTKRVPYTEIPANILGDDHPILRGVDGAHDPRPYCPEHGLMAQGFDCWYCEECQEGHPQHLSENIRLLISEFMNLVQACKMKGIAFEPIDGVSLEYCYEVINGHFKELGYSEERIKAYWSGENQLVSS